MSDRIEEAAGEAATEPASDLSLEIGNSLSSVWARYVGARPVQAEAELDGSVVRWVVTDGTKAFDAGMAEDAAESEPATHRTMAGFKRETAAAVAKATRRQVVAMISKHDDKTGIATETFILDSRRMKF